MADNYAFYNCDILDLPSDEELTYSVPLPERHGAAAAAFERETFAQLNCDTLDVGEEDEDEDWDAAFAVCGFCIFRLFNIS